MKRGDKERKLEERKQGEERRTGGEIKRTECKNGRRKRHSVFCSRDKTGSDKLIIYRTKTDKTKHTKSKSKDELCQMFCILE